MLTEKTSFLNDQDFPAFFVEDTKHGNGRFRARDSHYYVLEALAWTLAPFMISLWYNLTRANLEP